MHKLYHFTPKRNIENILATGIQPFYQSGLTRKTYHTRLRKELGNIVWLTDEPKFIIENQTGHKWADQNDLQVLEINISPYREILKARIVWCYDIPRVGNHEFYVTGMISSSDIVEIKSWKEWIA